MMKEEVRIDARVHSRLIGARGRNIRKIMEQFSVDIKFPRSTDPDPDIVTVIGAEDNVLDAKDHLLNLEEEYVSYFTVAVWHSYPFHISCRVWLCYCLLKLLVVGL